MENLNTKIIIYILIAINIIFVGLGYYSGWHDKELRCNNSLAEHI